MKFYMNRNKNFVSLSKIQFHNDIPRERDFEFVHKIPAKYLAKNICSKIINLSFSNEEFLIKTAQVRKPSDR